MRRNDIAVLTIKCVGGYRFEISLTDLPSAERLAYLRRELDTLHLDPGEYDDAAHAAFMEASSTRLERAERKAGIARLLVSIGQSVGWKERIQLVQERYGEKGTSKPSLKIILRDVKGVDPINYAPALLDGYKPTAKRAEMSDEAWQFFMTSIRDAAPDWPLTSAWRDVRDAGPKMGWAVPSYITFYRRWNDLDEAQRLHVRYGKDETSKRLSIPVQRDKTSISALEWVSLDGRTQDFWVDWGDGKTARPTMLALVDVASNAVLDWELSPSENATSTLRLVKRTCERYGIFDRLYTDNGSSFAGHLIAGGNEFRFRNGKPKEGVKPLGICKIMGIDLRFALPGNGQAKTAERTFATISRSIDDRPDFKDAHAGHKPGATPSPNIIPVPVSVALSVIKREIKRHNDEAGRRSQGARGRSYLDILRAGLETRIKRKPTARQLYLSGLVWKPVAVDRFGTVTVTGWGYGGPTTQLALLPHYGTGNRILLGRDPDDFSAPALAFDADGNLICEGIEPIKRGAYGSVDGIRQAARNRKAARDATAKAAAANDYMNDQNFTQAMAALNAATDADNAPNLPPAKAVIAGRFGAPLRKNAAPEISDDNVIDPDFYRNMDSALAADKARRGNSA